MHETKQEVYKAVEACTYLLRNTDSHPFSRSPCRNYCSNLHAIHYHQMISTLSYLIKIQSIPYVQEALKTCQIRMCFMAHWPIIIANMLFRKATAFISTSFFSTARIPSQHICKSSIITQTCHSKSFEDINQLSKRKWLAFQ